MLRTLLKRLPGRRFERPDTDSIVERLTVAPQNEFLKFRIKLLSLRKGAESQTNALPDLLIGEIGRMTHVP